MPRQDAFKPASTATLAVTAVSGAAAINANCPTLELQNAGDNACFVAWAPSGAVATTGGYSVLPGQSKTITIEQGHASLAAICAAGLTTTLYITSGEGL